MGAQLGGHQGGLGEELGEFVAGGPDPVADVLDLDEEHEALPRGEVEADGGVVERSEGHPGAGHFGGLAGVGVGNLVADDWCGVA